jgi:hypothetical protein
MLPVDNGAANRRSLTQSNCWRLGPHEDHGSVFATALIIAFRPINFGLVLGQISYMLLHCQTRCDYIGI